MSARSASRRGIPRRAAPGSAACPRPCLRSALRSHRTGPVAREPHASAPVIEPPAEETDEKEVLTFNSPGRAHREIAELGRLIGGIPTLHDALETLRQIVFCVALKPLRLDQPAAERRRGLLILAGEVVFSDRAAY